MLFNLKRLLSTGRFVGRGGPTSENYGGSPSILDSYVVAPPSTSAAFEIFKGEWSSIVPGLGLGFADLFNDQRILWLETQCGGFAGKSILELGPLEGGHTFMMAKFGAARIVAIESNTRAFLKCLIVKNALKFNADFQLGDFRHYLPDTEDRFDFVLACGVLYHMIQPERLLEDLSRVAPRLGLWTHYYDHGVLARRQELRDRFSNKPEFSRVGSREVEKFRQEYSTALDWKGFCGGTAPDSCWLTRDSLLGLLADLGFRVTIGADEPDHVNGPCILLYAERSSPREV